MPEEIIPCSKCAAKTLEIELNRRFKVTSCDPVPGQVGWCLIKSERVAGSVANGTSRKQKDAKKSTVRLPSRRTVVPDKLDLRDRPYAPAVSISPKPVLAPIGNLPVLYQGETNACTGFALATVVRHLHHGAKRGKALESVSPFMLYSMARRYDEFPGNPSDDSGSSLRGAMKGWYKHGACSAESWAGIDMPKGPFKSAAKDWWLNAVQRPLGAYYRVDTRSVSDMQVALNEVGVLYASAICHAGWDAGNSPGKVKAGTYWTIPPTSASPSDGGHAFAIVGYNREGFIVHNSWGTTWGSKGCAILPYEDWLQNAMDCWVAQLGVVTEVHEAIAKSSTLRTRAGRVQLASDPILRKREISPFIIDMENNGCLSNTGDFRTQESDVTALVNQLLGKARTDWGLGQNDAIDIAIYAHGGLVSENDAAETAARWIPAMYDRKIFPIFLMWESDLFSTLKNRLEDIISGQPRTTGGFLDSARQWWNERLEQLLASPGTAVWSEMKQNADAISFADKSGGLQLYAACKASPHFKDPAKIRLHLVGHSAGAIAHSYIIDRLGKLGWKFESVNFMAPAVRVDLFSEKVIPAIKNGTIKCYSQFHLSDEMEQKDPTCKPILGYGRSLLYLVSQSFESGQRTGVLGMEKYHSQLNELTTLPNARAFTAPGPAAGSTTHGGFDDDEATMKSVLALIKS